MKLKNCIHSIFILYILALCCAIRHYATPVYADNSDVTEYVYQSSSNVGQGNTSTAAYRRYGHNSMHQDFIKFGLSLNEVNHGKSEGNAVQRMREEKLDMPAYWFYSDGWRELTLDQKRTLVAGCVFFMNLYLRESMCFNEKLKTTYDQFSARITVEEIVDYVEKAYKMPQNQDEDAENLICDYMYYGFWDYLGLTIAYLG